jgi:hypothetical protein
METKVLVRNPPLSLIFMVFLHLLILFLPIYLIWLLVTGEKSVWNRGERVIAMIPLSILGLWMVYHLICFIRTVQRWIFHFSPNNSSGIYLKRDIIEFRVPIRWSRWNPLLKMRVVEMPVNDVCNTTFSDKRRPSLIVHTSRETIEIPSGTFTTGGYTLEQKLREHCPAIKSPVPGTVVWQPSTKAKLTLLATGGAILAASVIVIALVYASQPGDPESMFGFKIVALVAFLFGLGPILLSLLYSGQIIVDRRGVFYERSSKLLFISWQSFHSMKESNELGIKNIKIKGKNKQAIALSNMFGMGFPIDEIKQAVEINKELNSSLCYSPNP